MSSGYCPNCVSGWLHKGTPKGSETTIGGLPAYVSKPTKSNGRTILFIADIFGYKLPNPRLLADQYAEHGYTVYIPNILKDGAFPSDGLLDVAPLPSTIEEKGKEECDRRQQVFFGQFTAWLGEHPDLEVQGMLNKVVDEIKQNGPIFAVGFCWGGHQALLLGTRNPSISAVSILHPAGITEEDSTISIPVAVGYGSLDSLFSGPEAEKVCATIKSRNPLNEVKSFEGQVHGFAVRGDLSDKDTRIGYEGARDFTLSFFEKIATKLSSL